VESKEPTSSPIHPSIHPSFPCIHSFNEKPYEELISPLDAMKQGGGSSNEEEREREREKEQQKSPASQPPLEEVLVVGESALSPFFHTHHPKDAEERERRACRKDVPFDHS